ncbi:MAG: hypothetical protein ACYCZF_17550 [Anaerolineae bacterium]
MSGLKETTEYLNRLADAINQRGLNELAIVCLVTVRPFRYVLNQLMVIATPIFGWGETLGTSPYGWLLEDTGRFDQLISMLEEPAGIVRTETGND